YIILPLVFVFYTKSLWKNFALIFILYLIVGGYLGYFIFDSMHGKGFIIGLSNIIFYGFYSAFFVSSLYTIVFHLLNKKVGKIFLWSNIGIIIISFFLIGSFVLNNETIINLYGKYFGITLIVTEIHRAFYNLLPLIVSGSIFGLIGFFIKKYTHRK
ncbi:hypothetical protein KKF73_01805, partial [Patescibacteria group bacterium]|nr:hypothetical protein [Patescibacteria group bacterium]